jgi:hypothetical protein
MEEGMRILPFQYLKYLNGSLTWGKILRHGMSGFIPIRGRCAADFYRHSSGLRQGKVAVINLQVP